jgi:L-threonylcarbamoyladenylate synthase
MDGPEAIAEAVGRLRAGGLVAFPTETVYGLGADALNADAVARVFAAKGRPAHNPLIVHVSGVEMARRVVGAFDVRAQRVADAFWPGSVTIVLPRAEGVPEAVTAGGSTVAVRCPDHALALALIEAFGGPLVGPSANPSGYVSPTSAAHVRSHFGSGFGEGEVLVLDGGACRGGLESTVVDLSGERARVLRPGLVGGRELSAVLGEPADEASYRAEPDGVAPSPGLVGAHYQPRARVVVVDTIDGVDAELAALVGAGSAVVVSPPGSPLSVSPPHRSVAMPETARGYAAELYAVLREADEAGASVVVFALPGASDGGGGADAAVWAAVRERLGRAASG